MKSFVSKNHVWHRRRIEVHVQSVYGAEQFTARNKWLAHPQRFLVSSLSYLHDKHFSLRNIPPCKHRTMMLSYLPTRISLVSLDLMNAKAKLQVSPVQPSYVICSIQEASTALENWSGIQHAWIAYLSV